MKRTSSFSVFDPNAQHESPDRKISAALERLGQVMGVLLREESQSHGLSPIQIRILVHLLFRSGAACQVGDLAQEYDLTYATISDAISTLERKNLVVKIPGHEDARVRVLRLTEEGRELACTLADWAKPVHDVIDSHSNAYSDAEKVLVMRFLIDLITELQEAGIITIARMCTTCRFFGRDVGEPSLPHYCKLLKKPLKTSELRFDCPEHEVAA